MTSKLNHRSLLIVGLCIAVFLTRWNFEAGMELFRHDANRGYFYQEG